MGEVFKPHKYQKIAIKHILKTKRAGLFLDMGLGKTVITLTAIDKLMYDRLEINKVLIIAPLRVAEDTWSREVEKWEHLKHLTISKILGNVKERRKAIMTDADIYIINRENVVWLINELSSFGNGWGFDMVVVDELSSFKAPSSKRFKALKKYISRSSRVLGLTGTPSPNGLIDLWSQVYLIDSGERLGRTLTGYRERFFLPDKRNQQTIFSYKPKEEAEDNIHKKLEDICLSMTANDWLDLPERIDNINYITLDSKEKEAYKKFEREMVLMLLEGEVTAVTKGVLTNKLLQFCNGAMYLESGEVGVVSDKKIKALEEIVECSNGKPILCFYSYKHDLERIKKAFKNATVLENSETIEQWNKGEIQLLLTHPASAGHGLNLQAGGNIIVWFGLTWSLELYMQANARLHRQGQKESVIIHHLITKDTVEERVLNALKNKKEVQDDLMEYLKSKYKVREIV